MAAGAELSVTVDVPITTDKNTWTKLNPGQISPGPGTGGFSRRIITGAEWHIGRGDRLTAENGHVDLSDGTRVHWWLRQELPEGGRLNPYGPRAGFIAVLYDDELYDISRAEDARWRYRQFGIPPAEVMARTFLVIEPPTEGDEGIYPTGGRDRLLRKGARELPFADWGSAFHEQLPPAIAAAIEEAMPKELALDSAWKEKFAERFWDRLHQMRIRLRRDGTVVGGDPTQTAPKVDLPPSVTPMEARKPRLPRLAKPRERTPDLVVTDIGGRRRGRLTDIEAAIPSWLPVTASELDKSYTLASWDPDNVNQDGSTGCVYLNREHPAVVALVEEMAKDYSVTSSDIASWGQIEKAVWETLGQSLVAKVVHAQSVLRRDVELTRLRKEYLSDIALTTAGLGMIWEQQALQPKLGGILGRKKVG